MVRPDAASRRRRVEDRPMNQRPPRDITSEPPDTQQKVVRHVEHVDLSVLRPNGHGRRARRRLIEDAIGIPNGRAHFTDAVALLSCTQSCCSCTVPVLQTTPNARSSHNFPATYGGSVLAPLCLTPLSARLRDTHLSAGLEPR